MSQGADGSRFGPIDPGQRVADQAYHRLVEAALSGRLKPGARLSVPALAADMSVSRTPIREAVQRLVQEGLAREVPHRGAVLVQLQPVDLVPIYQVREVLEGLAARLAAERIDDRAAARLREIVAAHHRAVAANDRAGHTEHDMAFHAVVRELAGNGYLQSTLESIQSKILLAKRWTSGGAGPELAVADHERILEAIVPGEPDLAERQARAHIRRVRKRLEEAIV